MRLRYIGIPLLWAAALFLLITGVGVLIEVWREPGEQLGKAFLASLVLVIGLGMATRLWWGKIADWIEKRW